MTKKKIIIYIEDNCEEPFEIHDKDYISGWITRALEPYDVEIIKVEVLEDKEDA